MERWKWRADDLRSRGGGGRREGGGRGGGEGEINGKDVDVIRY